MSNVLILTAGYGEGHNAAARGLKEGFESVGAVNAEVCDLFAPAFGSFYQKSRRDYLCVINHAPRVWAMIYGLIDKVSIVPLALPFMGGLYRELVRVLREKQPVAVVSVYPVYGYLLERAAREAGVPRFKVFTIVTDSITVNSVWYRCSADHFLVANEDTAAVMRGAGVEPGLLAVTGFPVSRRFAAQAPERPEPSADVPPRVLYMVNGQPGRVVPLMERLLRQGGMELTVTAGKDERLKSDLEALALRMEKQLTVLGWVDNVPSLLRSHHVLIGKAGGAMVQEALAARTPMIMTQILPGQEEGNARLLLQNGCGAYCPTNEAVVSVLHQLFSNGAHGWRQMERHAASLGRPNAAEETARWMLARIAGEPLASGAGFGLRDSTSLISK